MELERTEPNRRSPVRGLAVARWLTVAVVGLAAIFSASLVADRVGGGNLGEILERLRTETSGSAPIVSMSAVSQEKWGVTAVWDVRLTEPWGVYRARTRRALEGEGFVVVRESAGEVVLARHTPGDVLVLGIAELVSAVPASVRISFEASAD